MLLVSAAPAGTLPPSRSVTCRVFKVGLSRMSMPSSTAISSQDVTPSSLPISAPQSAPAVKPQLKPKQTVEQAKAWAKAYLKKHFGSKRVTWTGCNNRSKAQRVSMWMAQYAALSCVIAGESRWNPAAVNPHSGACGFIQVNPCRKMGMTDYASQPLDQMKWAMVYTIRRYGSPLHEQQSRANRGWM